MWKEAEGNHFIFHFWVNSSVWRSNQLRVFTPKMRGGDTCFSRCMFLLVWEPAFKRMSFTFWLFISRITCCSFATVFLIIKIKRRQPFPFSHLFTPKLRNRRSSGGTDRFRWLVSIIVISFPIMHLCVRWKNNENKGLHHCAVEPSHTQWSRRWLLIYPWKYSGTTVFKIKTATHKNKAPSVQRQANFPTA